MSSFTLGAASLPAATAPDLRDLSKTHNVESVSRFNEEQSIIPQLQITNPQTRISICVGISIVNYTDYTNRATNHTTVESNQTEIYTILRQYCCI